MGNGSGFFGNPSKAFKGFVNDPIGKITTDLDKISNVKRNPTPQQQECYDKCYDHNFNNNISPTDKKKNALDLTYVASFAHCNKQCNKK